MDEMVLYIVPEATTLATPGNLVHYADSIRKKKEVPTLAEMLGSLMKDIEAADLKKWEATIEAYITVGKSNVVPTVEAGIKTTLTFSSAS